MPIHKPKVEAGASTSLALTPSTLDTPSLKLCAFVDKGGSHCPETKHIARGLCSRHYKALERRGAFHNPQPGNPGLVPTTPANIKASLRSIAKAQRKLIRHAPDYVDAMMAAVRIAAAKGDAGPAQWAILHTKIVQPVNTSAEPVKGGVTVNIGVKVSGTQTDLT